MSQPAIWAENIGKTFGSVDALRGVNLSVPAGSVYGLLGPNGAGKTTTIKILMNLLQPTEGQAEVLGRWTEKLAWRDFQKIASAISRLIIPPGTQRSARNCAASSICRSIAASRISRAA